MPYFLIPELLKLPDKVLDKKQMYLRRFKGNEEKLINMENTMIDLFNKEGLKYNIDGRVGHTLHAHRLMKYLKSLNVSNSDLNVVVESFFRAYHEQGKPLSDFEVLIEACQTTNLNVDIKDFLQSDRLINETLQDVIDLNNRSKKGEFSFVGGVPHFKISILADERLESSGEHVVLASFQLPGAQDKDYFVKIINKLLKLAKEPEAIAVSHL